MSYHNSDLLEEAKSRCTDCEHETAWMGLYHCSHPEVDADITAVIQCPIQDDEEGYIGKEAKMKLQKLVEIKARCKEAQNSLESEKEHPEWTDCGKCPLGGSVELSTGRIDNQYGIDSVKLLVNPCMLLEELVSTVKSKRKI